MFARQIIITMKKIIFIATLLVAITEVNAQETKIQTMLNNPSDERNLVYGRYFVVRFIFRNIDNVPFRFEDLNINYSKY